MACRSFPQSLLFLISTHCLVRPHNLCLTCYVVCSAFLTLPHALDVFSALSRASLPLVASLPSLASLPLTGSPLSLLLLCPLVLSLLSSPLAFFTPSSPCPNSNSTLSVLIVQTWDFTSTGVCISSTSPRCSSKTPSIYSYELLISEDPITLPLQRFERKVPFRCSSFFSLGPHGLSHTSGLPPTQSTCTFGALMAFTWPSPACACSCQSLVFSLSSMRPSLDLAPFTTSTPLAWFFSLWTSHRLLLSCTYCAPSLCHCSHLASSIGPPHLCRYIGLLLLVPFLRHRRLLSKWWDSPTSPCLFLVQNSTRTYTFLLASLPSLASLPLTGSPLSLLLLCPLVLSLLSSPLAFFTPSSPCPNSNSTLSVLIGDPTSLPSPLSPLGLKYPNFDLSPFIKSRRGTLHQLESLGTAWLKSHFGASSDPIYLHLWCSHGLHLAISRLCLLMPIPGVLSFVYAAFTRPCSFYDVNSLGLVLLLMDLSSSATFMHLLCTFPLSLFSPCLIYRSSSSLPLHRSPAIGSLPPSS
eukprot:Gb_18716 [translate_table: standard]